jgi:RHS repeat-associated protein
VLTYLHGDHLGSTSLTTDAGGGFVARVLYYPYGEERYREGTLQTDYQFTGQRKEGFGLYDYQARFYDPYLNRFISPDTIIPDTANPQDWNRYAYAQNNPLKYTDPSGHFVVAAILLVAGVAVVADWGVQVHNNMQQGQTFWEAAYHENLDEVEMVGAGVAGGGGAALAAVALPAVPAAVGAAGLTGTSAGVATVGVSAAVGGGASVAGEFGGRVWQNSMYEAIGESKRVDLWDASSYRNDLFWGTAVGAVTGGFNVASQSGLSAAQTNAATGLRTQAANDLWDLTLQQGGQWPPGSWSGSAADEGLQLYLQWQCGPTAGQIAQSTAEYAAIWQGAGDVMEVVVQDDALEKVFPIWPDYAE